MFPRCFALCAAVAANLPTFVFAQNVPLPEVVVTRENTGGSLTAPTTEQARREIQQTPGGVALIPDTQFKNTPAQSIKDIVDWTPGVWAQPKWGDDTRLSIRGSGLSRNFHLRGTQLFMDGIPINTSDGYGDFQEIDPTAYRYVEVYKGSNALRYGANSLGGAINFVTPTGRDASIFDSRVDGGGFGFLRGAASSGRAIGPFDYFVTGSTFTNNGYRQHSDGYATRGSANFGYQITPDIETRLYLNANSIRQRIPGEVTKTNALNNPRDAFATNVTNDWQRNVDSGRVASKTTVRLDNTTVDFGLYAVDRHLMHPIFEWLDYKYRDYGVFARAVNETNIAGHRNRLVTGFNILNGTIDAAQYANVGGMKGAMTKSLTQKPENYSAYAENSFYVLPTVAAVAGTQVLRAVREQAVNFTTQGDLNGRAEYTIWSPKGGLLWDITPYWQAFANVSRSGEAPSFGEGAGASTIPFFNIRAQTATTYEAGTRGRRPDFNWDVSVYRSNIRNELQCFFSAFGNCNVTNADRTVHQGIEAGFGAAIIKGLAAAGPMPDSIWVNVAYTYNDFFYDGDARFGNNRLPGAPPHYLRGEVLYKHPSGFSVGPNVEWAPKAYFVDSANTLATDPYILWGLRSTFERDGWSGYIEGRNLANKAYIASTSIIDVATSASRLFNPGNGRSVFAGLRMRL